MNIKSYEFIKNILNPFAHYKEREEEKQLENILNQKQHDTKNMNTRRLSNLRQTYQKKMKHIQYLDLHALKSQRKSKCWFC